MYPINSMQFSGRIATFMGRIENESCIFDDNITYRRTTNHVRQLYRSNGPEDVHLMEYLLFLVQKQFNGRTWPLTFAVGSTTNMNFRGKFNCDCDHNQTKPTRMGKTLQPILTLILILVIVLILT